jgi:hypothetical protein
VSEHDLSGRWDGGMLRHPFDWGDVRVIAAKDGYAGTYSDTYNGQLGTFAVKQTGERTYEGEWSESDKIRRGRCRWEVSKDGLRIEVTYDARDDPDLTRHRGGKCVWIRMSQ